MDTVFGRLRSWIGPGSRDECGFICRLLRQWYRLAVDDSKWDYRKGVVFNMRLQEMSRSLQIPPDPPNPTTSAQCRSTDWLSPSPRFAAAVWACIVPASVLAFLAKYKPSSMWWLRKKNPATIVDLSDFPRLRGPDCPLEHLLHGIAGDSDRILLRWERDLRFTSHTACLDYGEGTKALLSCPPRPAEASRSDAAPLATNAQKERKRKRKRENTWTGTLRPSHSPIGSRFRTRFVQGRVQKKCVAWVHVPIFHANSMNMVCLKSQPIRKEFKFLPALQRCRASSRPRHTPRRTIISLFFFFFCSIILALAYLDYGGALFYLDPVCRPTPKVGLDGSTFASPRSTDNTYLRTDRAPRKLQMKPDTRSLRACSSTYQFIVLTE